MIVTPEMIAGKLTKATRKKVEEESLEMMGYKQGTD